MAKNRVGKYPLSFRQMAMERMKDCPSVSALADKLGVHRTILYLCLAKIPSAPIGLCFL